MNPEEWEREAPSEAPGYYIAYNLACAYSRISEAEPALKWLTLAYHLNPGHIAGLMFNDKDLDFLNKHYTHEVKKILE